MLFAQLIGFAVLAGLLAWVAHTHTRMWRAMASSYASNSPRPILARKQFEQVLIAGSGLAFRNYVPLRVGIHEKGISLALWPPFSLGCPPLFLPFEEMRCRRTDWFLSKNVFAIRLAGAELDVIVRQELWDWIGRHHELRLST